MQREIEIYQMALIEESAQPYEVMEWSRDRDSGQTLQRFATRHEAVIFARAYARRHDAFLHEAEVVTLKRRGARA